MKPSCIDSATRRFIESLPAPLVVFRLQHEHSLPLVISQGMLDLLGVDSREMATRIMGVDSCRNIHPDDVARVAESVREFIEGGRLLDLLFRNRREGGTSYQVIHVTGSRIGDHDDLAALWYTDESASLASASPAQASLATRLVSLAPTASAQRAFRYDDLTGLPNSRYFSERIEEDVGRLIDDGAQPVILYLDYSDFKEFNRRYGFDEGDALIRETGRVLRAQFGIINASRLESDHYACFTAREGLEERLDALLRDLDLCSVAHGLPVRIGIYEYAFEHVSPTEAITRAKLACDSLKGRSESAYAFFNQKILDRAQLRSFALANLNRAFEEGWIRVYYQPVVHTLSHTVCGAEALARWVDPDHGLLSPADFIPALEESGQIFDLDLHMIELVCRDYRNALANHREIASVSFNLSRKDLQHADVVERITRIVDSYEVPRSMLNIEITESAFVERSKEIERVIERFHREGFQIWMDDFGTGYSSLGNLKDYRFDELKIDMSFLSSQTEKAREIVRSTVRMAKRIGIGTLAEGVETEEQYRFLKSIGCEKVQGYYFGKPLPGADLRAHCVARGLTLETTQDEHYYRALARINYQTDEPMCVVEDDGARFTFLFTNEGYDEALAKDGIPNLARWEQELNEHSDPMAIFHRSFVDQKVRALGGTQTITYPSGDHYMQLKARLIASTATHRAYQAWLRYVEMESDSDESQRIGQLSDLYYVCNDIVEFDLATDTIDVLKSSLSNQPIGKSDHVKGIATTFAAWERDFVYLPDRARFQDFCDPATLAQRLAKAPNNLLAAHFRSKSAQGDYRWLIHLAVPVPKTDFTRFLYVTLESGLTQQAVTRIMASFSEDADAARAAGPQADADAMTSAILWENELSYSYWKFFWKDRNRRFAGASQSFLDFYGIASIDELLGKTDEEMGWHINDEPYRKQEESVIAQGRPAHNILVNCIVQGSVHTLIVDKTPIFRDGKIVGLMGAFFDADALTDAAERAFSMMHTDPVTGLSNAMGIAEGITRYLEELWGHKSRYAIIRVFVKEYGVFSQLYGKEAGDELLRAIGTCLKEVFGNNAVIGRLVDSQFIVLTAFKEAEAMKEKTDQVYERIGAIRSVGEWRCTCTAQITMSLSSEGNNTEGRYANFIYQAISEYLGGMDV